MPRIIGLTGNIACGKTSVGRMLLELGAEHYIDADVIVHQLYQKGLPIAQQVAENFGVGVLASDGSVDRKALGAIVFHNPNALATLERIVHPAVREALLDELKRVSASSIVIIDAVKLLEGASGALCHSKWLVVCSQEQEIARLMVRNQLSADEARIRVEAQPDTSSKLVLVDEVINNSGSLAETHGQVAAAFDRFCRKFPV
ncbi:MAG TPA: dephospho-CoA kinase [Ktedonobacteraceae bacterium]|nr:dephospho-CoA kinase [Ktedonobacteraceae bacterium]